MNREVYNTLEEFMESDELTSYRETVADFKEKDLLEEEDFNLDSINFLQVINYPISWWIDRLDKDLWWQPEGKYIMLYGGPSTGKTTLTFQIAIDNQARGNKVCYLSFEMPKKDFIIQNMRTRAWLKQSGVGESVLPTPWQQRIMKDFIESIRDIDIKGYVKQPSLKDFKNILDSLKRSGYQMIIIDNLWMIGRSDGKDEMALYWEISATVKDFCDSSNTSVMMLHHTNKGWEAQAGKRWFWAFRWNWKLADDCDYVIQLERAFNDDWTTQSKIKVEKDRISWRNWYTLDLIFNEWVFKGDCF